MALTTGAFPYDITNLLGGAVRILYADIDEPVPATMTDVFLVESPYTAQTGWTDLGATPHSFTYTRGFDVEGWEIQQLAGNVIEEVTDLTRTIEVSFADLRPEHLAMIENQSAAVEDVTAVASASAQKVVRFGSFQSFTRYRFAFVSRRPLAAGAVTESAPSGAVRGRFFMGVAYQAQIAADEAEFEQNKGELTAAGVTFTLFPDSDEDQGEEYGAWFDEVAGTIA